jgi:hypothetical protein
VGYEGLKPFDVAGVFSGFFGDVFGFFAIENEAIYPRATGENFAGVWGDDHVNNRLWVLLSECFQEG